MESDSHADTCALGANLMLVNETDSQCTVHPFNASYEPLKQIPIGTGATAYDDKIIGETTILIVNQGLWFGLAMRNSLICPQQVRSYGLTFCDDPYDQHRGIDDRS